MSKRIRLKDFVELQQLLPESSQTNVTPKPRTGHDGKGRILNVMLDTKGRKGKAVTLISGFQHNPDTMEEIARTLKQFCGAGGTVKGMTVEIQGDQRARVSEKLREMNYAVQ